MFNRWSQFLAIMTLIVIILVIDIGYHFYHKPSTVVTVAADLSPKQEPIYVSVLITSCARWDLLTATIKSFERHNSYKYIGKKIVIDDCTDDVGFIETRNKFKHLNYEFIHTTTPRKSPLDHYKLRAGLTILDGLNHVNTRWVLHIEDDWRFYRSHFIEKSLEIMLDNIASQLRISMITLRNLQIYEPYVSNYEFCGGPTLNNMQNETYVVNKTLLYLLSSDGNNPYHHWSANPGLKYVKHLKSNLQLCRNIIWSRDKIKYVNTEKCVAGFYQKQQYIMAIMSGNGFVGHMGHRQRHVDQRKDAYEQKRQLLQFNETNCLYLSP